MQRNGNGMQSSKSTSWNRVGDTGSETEVIPYDRENADANYYCFCFLRKIAIDETDFHDYG